MDPLTNYLPISILGFLIDWNEKNRALSSLLDAVEAPDAPADDRPSLHRQKVDEKRKQSRSAPMLLRPARLTPPFKQSFETCALFADISGFTSLCEALAQARNGDEKLAKHLNSYFEVLLRIISSMGGDVFKFAGDALLVLWPPSSEDVTTRARRATQCALEIKEVLETLSFQVPNGRTMSLSVKVSVGVGPCSILHVGGVFDRMEYMATGTALVQALRAESYASKQPHERVVVSPETWALIRDYFNHERVNKDHVFVRECHDPLRKISLHVTAKTEKRVDAAVLELVKNYIPSAVVPFIHDSEEKWASELRRITVLFINLDLRESLLHDGQSDADLARVHEAVARVQRAVYRYEGSLNKFLMDDKGVSVLAVFGLPPLAHEDDAVRGVLSSLAVCAALHELGLTPSIGITTGTAFCGVIGSHGRRREYSVLGDTVNLSSRLMSHATHQLRGGVICDAVTMYAGRDRLIFEKLGRVQVKGRSEPVKIYSPYPKSLTHLFREGSPHDSQRRKETASLLSLEDQQALGLGAHDPLRQTPWRGRLRSFLSIFDSLFTSGTGNSEALQHPHGKDAPAGAVPSPRLALSPKSRGAGWLFRRGRKMRGAERGEGKGRSKRRGRSKDHGARDATGTIAEDGDERRTDADPAVQGRPRRSSSVGAPAPRNVMDQIHNFQVEGYAQQHFMQVQHMRNVAMRRKSGKDGMLENVITRREKEKRASIRSSHTSPHLTGAGQAQGQPPSPLPSPRRQQERQQHQQEQLSSASSRFNYDVADDDEHEVAANVEEENASDLEEPVAAVKAVRVRLPRDAGHLTVEVYTLDTVRQVKELVVQRCVARHLLPPDARFWQFSFFFQNTSIKLPARIHLSDLPPLLRANNLPSGGVVDLMLVPKSESPPSATSARAAVRAPPRSRLFFPPGSDESGEQQQQQPQPEQQQQPQQHQRQDRQPQSQDLAAAAVLVDEDEDEENDSSAFTNNPMVDVHRYMAMRMERLVRQRQGGTIVVEGEMGIGKSHLLSNTVVEAPTHLPVLCSAGNPFEQDKPLSVWREIFFQMIDGEVSAAGPRTYPGSLKDSRRQYVLSKLSLRAAAPLTPTSASDRKLRSGQAPEAEPSPRGASPGDSKKRGNSGGSSPRNRGPESPRNRGPESPRNRGPESPRERKTSAHSQGSNHAGGGTENGPEGSSEPPETLATFAPLLNDLLQLDFPQSSPCRNMQGRDPGAALEKVMELLLALMQLFASHRRSLIVIIDDAIHLDAASWRLAHLLSREVDGLLLLLSTRPFKRSEMGHFVTSIPHEYRRLVADTQTVLIELKPRPNELVYQMACEELRVDSISPLLAALILEKAHGNPLVLKEFVYALQQNGLVEIDREKRSCTLSKNLRGFDAHELVAYISVPVPVTLQAHLGSRLDRLSLKQQMMMKTAAIIGAEFSYDVMYEVYPLHDKDEESFRPEFQQLIEHFRMIRSIDADPVDPLVRRPSPLRQQQQQRIASASVSSSPSPTEAAGATSDTKTSARATSASSADVSTAQSDPPLESQIFTFCNGFMRDMLLSRLLGQQKAILHKELNKILSSRMRRLSEVLHLTGRALHQGFLFMRHPSSPTWGRYFFVLSDTCLAWWETMSPDRPAGMKPNGCLFLERGSISHIDAQRSRAVVPSTPSSHELLLSLGAGVVLGSEAEEDGSEDTTRVDGSARTEGPPRASGRNIFSFIPSPLSLSPPPGDGASSPSAPSSSHAAGSPSYGPAATHAAAAVSPLSSVLNVDDASMPRAPLPPHCRAEYNLAFVAARWLTTDEAGTEPRVFYLAAASNEETEIWRQKLLRAVNSHLPWQGKAMLSLSRKAHQWDQERRHLTSMLANQEEFGRSRSSSQPMLASEVGQAPPTTPTSPRTPGPAERAIFSALAGGGAIIRDAGDASGVPTGVASSSHRRAPSGIAGSPVSSSGTGFFSFSSKQAGAGGAGPSGVSGASGANFDSRLRNASLQEESHVITPDLQRELSQSFAEYVEQAEETAGLGGILSQVVDVRKHQGGSALSSSWKRRWMTLTPEALFFQRVESGGFFKSRASSNAGSDANANGGGENGGATGAGGRAKRKSMHTDVVYLHPGLVKVGLHDDESGSTRNLLANGGAGGIGGPNGGGGGGGGSKRVARLRIDCQLWMKRTRLYWIPRPFIVGFSHAEDARKWLRELHNVLHTASRQMQKPSYSLSSESIGAFLVSRSRGAGEAALLGGGGTVAIVGPIIGPNGVRLERAMSESYSSLADDQSDSDDLGLGPPTTGPGRLSAADIVPGSISSGPGAGAGAAAGGTETTGEHARDGSGSNNTHATTTSFVTSSSSSHLRPHGAEQDQGSSSAVSAPHQRVVSESTVSSASVSVSSANDRESCLPPGGKLLGGGGGKDDESGKSRSQGRQSGSRRGSGARSSKKQQQQQQPDQSENAAQNASSSASGARSSPRKRQAQVDPVISRQQAKENLPSILMTSTASRTPRSGSNGLSALNGTTQAPDRSAEALSPAAASSSSSMGETDGPAGALDLLNLIDHELSRLNQAQYSTRNVIPDVRRTLTRIRGTLVQHQQLCHVASGDPTAVHPDIGSLHSQHLSSQEQKSSSDEAKDATTSFLEKMEEADVRPDTKSWIAMNYTRSRPLSETSDALLDSPRRAQPLPESFDDLLATGADENDGAGGDERREEKHAAGGERLATSQGPHGGSVSKSHQTGSAAGGGQHQQHAPLSSEAGLNSPRTLFRAHFHEQQKGNERVYVYRGVECDAKAPAIARIMRGVTFELGCFSEWHWDVFQFDKAQLTPVLASMFNNLDLLETFRISAETFVAFVDTVRAGYLDNPYHNFRHAVDVCQSVYCFFVRMHGSRYHSPLQMLSLLIAALCHDLQHPGLNNTYQINAQTPLAMLYNDQSVLEHMHCAATFRVLSRAQTNLLANLTHQQYRQARSYIIHSILATDMRGHFALVEKFNQLIPKYISIVHSSQRRGRRVPRSPPPQQPPQQPQQQTAAEQQTTVAAPTVLSLAAAEGGASGARQQRSDTVLTHATVTSEASLRMLDAVLESENEGDGAQSESKRRGRRPSPQQGPRNPREADHGGNGGFDDDYLEDEGDGEGDAEEDGCEDEDRPGEGTLAERKTRRVPGASRSLSPAASRPRSESESVSVTVSLSSGGEHKYLELPEQDAQLIMSTLLHSADISNPCKPWDLAKRWSDLVADEFFHQGDVERSKNLPISPNCDRYTTDRVELALSFCDFIVAPLYVSLRQFMSRTEVCCEQLSTNRKELEKIIEHNIDNSEMSTIDKAAERARWTRRTTSFYQIIFSNRGRRGRKSSLTLLEQFVSANKKADPSSDAPAGPAGGDGSKGDSGSGDAAATASSSSVPPSSSSSGAGAASSPGGA